MKKRLPLIDIFKLIFAIGILAIHSGLLDSKDNFTWIFLHSFLRLSVPFFFCASGYFLYKSLKNSKNEDETIKKYLIRLLIPMLFWMILNLPLVIYNYHLQGDGLLKIILKIVRGAIFYPWGSMWYLHALIIAVLIIKYFYKNNKMQIIVSVGMILYLFALLCNTYYFVFENTIIQQIIDFILKIISSARNGIFEGLYFVSVGMYISKMNSENRIHKNKNIFIFVICYILLIVEVLLTKNTSYRDDHSLFIMYIPLIPSFFLTLSNFDYDIDTTLCRNYSTGIYFSHRFIMAIVILFINSSKVIVVFSITLLLVISILSLLYKIDNKKINYLIK